MVRNAMFQKVQLAARDRFTELGELETPAAALSEPPARVMMTAAAWEERLGAYRDEHETMGSGPAARAPELLMIDRSPPGADGPHLGPAPDHRRSRSPPRLGDRGDGRPRLFRRRGRAGDPDAVIRAGGLSHGTAAPVPRARAGRTAGFAGWSYFMSREAALCSAGALGGAE